MDFTFEKIYLLIETLLKQNYRFLRFNNYLKTKKQDKLIILRHDVEQHYAKALKFASIQHQMGIMGTYYFRLLPQHFHPEIVKKIAEMGHEIGYHYDDLTQTKGNRNKALLRFERNLETLRKIAPVHTICMDGSPLSKFDNKSLWENASYKDFKIYGEPYFDINFNEVFYLTDTGRRWDGWKVSLRDKVPQQEQWIKQGLVFHSTNDIINAATENRLPDKIMITFHPQRWNDKYIPWARELVWQNVKNMGKRILVQMQNSNQ